MRATTVLSGEDEEALARLGLQIRSARLRRDMSQDDFAARIGVAKPSVVALERGKPGTGIGILARALTVLGYPGRLGDLLASDPTGEDIEAVSGRRRASKRADVADF